MRRTPDGLPDCQDREDIRAVCLQDAVSEQRRRARPDNIAVLKILLTAKLTGCLWGSAAVSPSCGVSVGLAEALTCPADLTLGGEILRLLGAGDQLSE
jgi:hypothetical protein